MSTSTHSAQVITCTTFSHQMVQTVLRTCLAKEILIRGINQLTNSYYMINITNTFKSTKNALVLLHNSAERNPPQAGSAYKIRETIVQSSLKYISPIQRILIK